MMLSRVMSAFLSVAGGIVVTFALHLGVVLRDISAVLRNIGAGLCHIGADGRDISFRRGHDGGPQLRLEGRGALLGVLARLAWPGWATAISNDGCEGHLSGNRPEQSSDRVSFHARRNSVAAFSLIRACTRSPRLR